MPYFITNEHPDCPSWATVKEDGELVACHESEQDAIDQMVAISIAEDMEPGGTYEGDTYRSLEERAEPGELAIGDFVEWDSSGGMARGRIEHIMTEGVLGVPDSEFSINATEENPAALIRIYRQEENDDGDMEWEETETLVGHRFETLTKIDPLTRSENRQVNLVAPAFMRAAARQGLRYYEQGLAGDGLVQRTVTEARQMARGAALTPDKWVRIAAWVARHLVDLDAPSADPENDDYPSAGVVAHLLWGSGPSKRAANRAMEYAQRIVARLEEENEGRARGEAVKKLETRINPVQFEVRETDDGGMTFEGYASVFNSRSENLGGFTEVVAPGAFKRSLRARNDIKLLWNHDTGSVLGSTRAGTLTLTEDDRGLKVRADLAPTTLGKDVAVLLRRGDIDAMSFGFSVIKDTWDASGSERTLNSVRLHEVSIVAFPAYQGTAGTTSVRGLDKIAQRADVDADALADVLLKLEEGSDMTLEEVDLLSHVVDKLKPESETEPESNVDLELLALKKKKLEMLEKY